MTGSLASDQKTERIGMKSKFEVRRASCFELRSCGVNGRGLPTVANGSPRVARRWRPGQLYLPWLKPRVISRRYAARC